MPALARGPRYILLAIGATALAVIVWKLNEVVVIAFGGVVGAALLRALAGPVTRWTRISDRGSLALVLLGLGVITGGLIWLFGSQIAEETAQLRQVLPSSVQQVTAALQRSSIGRFLVDLAKQLPDNTEALSHLGLAAGVVLIGVANGVLIFFLSIYFAFAPDEYRNGFLRLLPPSRRARVGDALGEAGRALRQWLLAQVIAMFVVGALVGVGLAVLRIPLALLLAVLAGLLEFVPVVGPLIFTLPGVLVAFTEGPAKALYVLLLYLVVQQLESNVIIPLLQRWAVRLPPALALLSVVIGGILFGVPGVIFATPLAVVTLTLVKRLYVEDTLEKSTRRSDDEPAARA